jgi:cell division protease FtsH
MDTQYLKQKQAILERARTQLKQKFFGIEEVIDQVIDSITSWYHFPEFQSRPLIICLWGMTGVGKSDLVRQLVSLLEFEDNYFQFDMGELGIRESGTVRDVLSKLLKHQEPKPAVILLDEFQIKRTISEDGNEVSNSEGRVIWQLIDDGKLSFQEYWHYRETRIEDLLQEFSFWMAKGIQVRNGLVSMEFRDYLENKYEDQAERNKIDLEEFLQVPENRIVFNKEDIRILFENSGFTFGSKEALKRQISTMDEKEIQVFLHQCWDRFTKPKSINLSKGLIFIAGNLDEVYRFHGNQSSDISADEFYARSLEIQLPDVKRALLKRFRSEQIARLGNNHIIYPSLSKKAFHEIIEYELQIISKNVEQKTGMKLVFGNSLKNYVYEEGVVPTQGVRPLKSTIRYSVEDLVPRILFKAGTFKENPTQIQLDYEDGIKAFYIHESEILGEILISNINKVEKLKKNRSDDHQASVAVHESGHAVLYMAMFGEAPEKVLSVASDSGVNGMVQLTTKRKYLTLAIIKKQSAVLLAGFEAESLVFSPEHVTDGSSRDIETVTELVMTSFKTLGLGSELIRIATFENEYTEAFHNLSEIEEKARQFILEIQVDVRNVLKREKSLLLQMSSILADRPSLGKEEIKSLASIHGSEELNQSLENNERGFREMLFEQSEQMMVQ